MFAIFSHSKTKPLLAVLLLASGCNSLEKAKLNDSWDQTPSYHAPAATRIEYPNVQSRMEPESYTATLPLALENPADLPTRELTLDEAVRMALTQGDVLRTLGGSVVQNPLGVRTQYDPAITESNPLGGVEAALSAFDAQVSGQLFWQKNDRPNNTTFLIFQPSALEQTAASFNYEVAKTTATGASFAARHVVGYDRNNSPVRFFPSDYVGWFEAEYRQPLLQGAGTDFNRIAGPNSGIGQYNGVLIARINSDISLADFEQSVVTFVNDVESAYWELYFAYHSLEAAVQGRDNVLQTWQRLKRLDEAGQGNKADEPQTRSQYYAFDAQVKEALAGPAGLYAREQQLRYLLGLTATDGTLLKPSSAPMDGEVIVDWNSALADALSGRVEVRRQKWTIKRRELELIAAKLNRRPTLDFLAQYRYRGLGDDLIGSRDPNNSFNSLYQNIFEGDYQEWQAGIEFGYPVGLRQASAAIANARWNLARERALLDEQELRITHDLSTASRQIQRAYELMKTNYIRVQADSDQVEVLQARYDGGLDNISFLLQARQQLANSESAYFRSLTDYQLALRDFHREKGSLLNYAQVGMSESAWPSGAYQDATERGRFFTPTSRPARTGPSVSRGGFDPTSVGAQATVGTVGEFGGSSNTATGDLASVPSSPFDAPESATLPTAIGRQPLGSAAGQTPAQMAEPLNLQAPIMR
ncbi:MAG: TolC family protein [Aureliella sp.]